MFLVLWGLITHGTYAGSGDEPHYQMIAHSLVFDGDVDLANNYADPDNLITGAAMGAHAIAGKDGTLRPVHDIGLPLVFSPYFAVAYRVAQQAHAHLPQAWLARTKLNGPLILRHLLSLGMSVVAVWIALQLFELFAVTAGPVRAMGWAALLVLSPPLLSHAFLFFTEVLSAALVLCVFRWMRTPSPQVGVACWMGIVTGGLFLVHVRNVGLVAALIGLMVYGAWRSRERVPALLWFLCGVAVAVALRTMVNVHFWGTWLTTPHAAPQMPIGIVAVVTETATRFVGWMLDQEHGLLLYAPIYLLAPAGWVALWRRNRELCVQVSWIIGVYLAVVALPFVNSHGWRGGWSPAARFLVPIAPLLALLAFTGASALTRVRWAVGTFVVVQIALDAFLWQHPRLLWNDGVGTSALLTYVDGGTGSLSSLFPSFAGPQTLWTLAMPAAAIVLWLEVSRRAVRHS